jgi:hypothetical protein
MSLVIQKPTGGKLNLSKIQQYPAVIGEPWGGGFFAGYISHTADGNPTHALIVAPRATGATGTGYTLTTDLAWKTSNTTTAGTTSSFDGAANTAAMVAAGIVDHPAAQFCVNLSVGGFTDWYLPSRLELEIAYFNLKPTAATNNTTVGANTYAVPQRNSNYIAIYPAQTTLTAFNTTTEAFVDNIHFSSTDVATTISFALSFANGLQSSFSNPNKTFSYRVRAFRRIALP